MVIDVSFHPFWRKTGAFFPRENYGPGYSPCDYSSRCPPQSWETHSGSTTHSWILLVFLQIILPKRLPQTNVFQCHISVPTPEYNIAVFSSWFHFFFIRPSIVWEKLNPTISTWKLNSKMRKSYISWQCQETLDTLIKSLISSAKYSLSNRHVQSSVAKLCGKSLLLLSITRNFICMWIKVRPYYRYWTASKAL